MNWFIRIADINYQALGFSPSAETYLRSLNNWDRGTAVELSKLTNEKGASRFEYHLNNYKAYLHNVQGKIPNRFLFFIYGWLVNGQIRLPEDLGRLTNALTIFTQQNNKFELKNLQQYPSLGDLEVAVGKVLGVKDEESKRQVAKNIKMQGSREIFRDNEWRVIEMTTPEAVCELGKGTKWCTNADADGYENAQMYLDGGPLLLFLHNENGKWQKYAQATKSLDQVMDVLDKRIKKPTPSFISLLRSLIRQGYISKQDFLENYAFGVSYEGADVDLASFFMEKVQENDGAFPKYAFDDVLEYAKKYGRLKAIENNIIFKQLPSDKKTLKNYGVIEGSRIEEYINAVSQQGLRWQDPKQESVIINSSYAFEYWKDRYSEYQYGEGKPGNGDFTPWPEYEAAMLNNPNRAEELVGYLWYLNGSKRAEKRFEDYLLETGKQKYAQDHSIEYAKNCNFRWPELEKIIIDSGKIWDMYEYAKEVIKGRWPEVENYLLNDRWGGLSEALYYARDVVKQRWPELEKRIMELKNGWAAGQYAVNIMKARWPEMERYILSNKDIAVPSFYQSNFGYLGVGASKRGWYKRADFPEYNVFHGTSDQNSIQERGFVYDYIGQGNDQYGPGFYFTSRRETASNYGQGGPSPGVMQAKVNLKKPIQISSGNIEQSNAFDIFPSLTANQTRGLLKLAVQLEGKQILDNFGDVATEGERVVFESMARAYIGKSSAFILYDLFNKSNFEKVLRFISKATGYDGIVVNHGNNIDPSKKNELWVVAWFPEQIQVIGKSK